MEVNGEKSSSKRNRAINIRYFWLTDQIEKKNAEVQYCPTDKMIGDYFTKPKQGAAFKKFRALILGEK